MIYTYIQQGVLATKSSHIKVPGQVSLINSLIFKQQKTMSHSLLNIVINISFYKGGVLQIIVW